jgi:hypothetical protein
VFWPLEVNRIPIAHTEREREREKGLMEGDEMVLVFSKT